MEIFYDWRSMIKAWLWGQIQMFRQVLDSSQRLLSLELFNFLRIKNPSWFADTSRQIPNILNKFCTKDCNPNWCPPRQVNETLYQGSLTLWRTAQTKVEARIWSGPERIHGSLPRGSFMRFSKSAPLKPAVRWAISVRVMFSSNFLLPQMGEFTNIKVLLLGI